MVFSEVTVWSCVVLLQVWASLWVMCAHVVGYVFSLVSILQWLEIASAQDIHIDKLSCAAVVEQLHIHPSSPLLWCRTNHGHCNQWRKRSSCVDLCLTLLHVHDFVCFIVLFHDACVLVYIGTIAALSGV